jgi:hypothetical protein
VFRERASGKGSWVRAADGGTIVSGVDAGAGACGAVLVHPQNRSARNNTNVMAIAGIDFIFYYSILPLIKDVSG